MKPFDEETARHRLEEILSRDEYRVYDQTDDETFKNWLAEWLESLFPEFAVSGEMTEWISYLVIALGIILFLLFILGMGRKIVRQSRLKAKPAGTRAELVMSARRHLLEANKKADEGDFREALRHVFLALLLALDEQGRIKARHWKTNREYYQELTGSDPDTAPFFYKMAIRFDEVVYGDRLIDARGYREFRKQVLARIEKTDPETDGIPRETGRGGTTS
ncbi:MAG: DUF4129 domain-containing protein [Bacillaceae bacterium]|nr:DUF4129 domain-containing protein [Bacillaceae bacterium]